MVVEHIEFTEITVLESIALWPDGEWCFEADIEEMLASPCAKSDDFAIMPYEYALARGYIEKE